MKYASCRGSVRDQTFEDVLFSGYASDGGMFVPESIPQLSREAIESWSKLPYKEIVKNIISLFVSEEELPKDHLNGLVEKALSRFEHPQIVSVAALKDGLNILELFHGVTAAFKDLGISVLAQLLEHYLNKRQQHVTIVVVTSGDTGSAALEAMRGLKWVDIICCLPRGRTSRIQELQMTTVIEDNVHVYRVDGTSDDIDKHVRPLFTDKEFAQTHRLMSVNSVNWVRIMVQIAHYFHAYYQMCGDCNDEVNIIVPTGGCGNITAGYIAQMMGLPIKLTSTTNHNDVVHNLLQRGDFLLTDIKPSIAPAMDIGNPYNFQRIFYYLSGKNGELVKELLEKFESGEKVQIPDDLFKKLKLLISSQAVDDDQIKLAMKKCFHENSYLLCPHTATAVSCFYDNHDRYKKRTICIATASPVKFREAVLAAGLVPMETDAIKQLSCLATKFIDLEATDDCNAILRSKIVKLSTSN